jgi:hypothetical protein
MIIMQWVLLLSILFLLGNLLVSVSRNNSVKKDLVDFPRPHDRMGTVKELHHDDQHAA